MNPDTFDRYVSVLKRKLLVLVVVSALVAAGAYGLTARLPTTYQVHFSYLVALTQREGPTADYHFDGYYALQATDLFTTTVAAWTTTPEVIVAAYQVAKLPVPTADTRVLLQKITAEKSAPQLIEVTVHDTQAQIAQALAYGLQTVMQKQVELYQQQGSPALTFKIVPTNVWTGEQRVDRRIITITTFILILFVGLNLVILRESLRGV